MRRKLPREPDPAIILEFAASVEQRSELEEEDPGGRTGTALEQPDGVIEVTEKGGEGMFKTKRKKYRYMQMHIYLGGGIASCYSDTKTESLGSGCNGWRTAM